MSTRRRLVPFFFTCICTAAHANVPAAYLPCEGAADGDDCQMSGRSGACVLDTVCTDHVVLACTECDKCLLCGDPCRGLEPGDTCTMGDGTDGTCKHRAGCTDDPKYSFDECNHCLPHAQADCQMYEGGTGHWEQTSGACLGAADLPDDDLCWKCLPGPGESVKAKSGGCQSGRGLADGAAGVAWLLLAGLVVRELRRLRRGARGADSR